MNVFFNTKFANSQNNFEKVGNLFLTPSRYLLNGKDYAYIDAKLLRCSPSFAKDKKTFLKTTLAVIAFIPGTILGALFKGLGHLSKNVRQHSTLIKNFTVNSVTPVVANPEVPTNPNFIDHKALAQKDLAAMGDDQMDSDWGLNRYFGNIQIINLDHQKDKYKECTDNLRQVGLKEGDYERFSAILGKDLDKEIWNRCKSKLYPDQLDKLHQNQAGCYMSHYTVIKQAKANYDKAMLRLEKAEEALNKAKKSGSVLPELTKEVEEAKAQVHKYSSTLILEDDNKFGRLNSDETTFTYKKVGRVFREAMLHLPNDWDMVYFSAFEFPHGEGANPFIPNIRMKQLIYAYDLNAYAVSAKFYDKALEILKKIEQPGVPYEAVDVEYALVMKDHQIYASTPPLASQGGTVSSIRPHDEEIPYVQRNGWQWEKMRPISA